MSSVTGLTVVILLLTSVWAMGSPRPTGWSLVYGVFLLFSVGFGAALYANFPKEYEALCLKPQWLQQPVYWWIPITQTLSMHVALTTVGSTECEALHPCAGTAAHIHAFAVLIYFLLFVVWDFVLLKAKPKPEYSTRFQDDVRDYLWFVDFPTFVAAVIGVAATYTSSEPAAPFFAGVAAAQGLAAMTTFSRRACPALRESSTPTRK